MWPNELNTSDCSERGYVVGAQGLDSEVTRKSEASMPNEGLSAPKGTLAERRYTSAPSQRPQDSTQTVSLLSTLILQRETRWKKKNYCYDGRLTNAQLCASTARSYVAPVHCERVPKFVFILSLVCDCASFTTNTRVINFEERLQLKCNLNS